MPQNTYLKRTITAGVVLLFLLVGCTSNASIPGSVVISVSKEQMAVIESLPKDVVCLTSAKNPIESLEGLKDDEFASWVTSPTIPQKLMAAFGRQDTLIGLHIVGTGNADAHFDENPDLRLFITHAVYLADLIEHGGVKIIFQVR